MKTTASTRLPAYSPSECTLPSTPGSEKSGAAAPLREPRTIAAATGGHDHRRRCHDQKGRYPSELGAHQKDGRLTSSGGRLSESVISGRQVGGQQIV